MLSRLKAARAELMTLTMNVNMTNAPRVGGASDQLPATSDR
jgi:hypothetical protein